MHTTLPLLLAALTACKDDAPPDDSGPEGWRPDTVCPGDPSCPDNDGPLRVGAAAVPISPTCFEQWVDQDGNNRYGSAADAFLDCGCDQLCPDDAGYPGPDEGEGDDTFQATWMAGFSNGRPAQGVHDELWARTLVLDQGGSRIAIVSLDLVGFFFGDVEAIRADLDPALEVDHVLISSTHTHEGPDTMGLWGPRVGSSGYQESYVAEVREDVAASIAQAVGALTEVDHVVVGAVDPAGAHERGQANVQRDSRDPVVIVDAVNVAAFYDGGGDVIASLVNWGSHPETLSSDNTLISADFVHYLRETVESGARWDSYEREGLGGVCVYVQGMVGGMMTPLGITVHDPDGNEWSAASFEKAEALGQIVGEMALDAVEAGETLQDPALSFAAARFQLPVQNIAFEAMFRIGVLPRDLENFDPDGPVDPDDPPEVVTEMDHIALGDLAMLSIPGELLPEIGIGGYDGSKVGTDLYTLVDPNNPNPPDLDAAPEGPYLRERMDSPHAWIIGLANDELGYIIPAYDFITDPDNPYLVEAEGDHYEETNSLGPQTEPVITAQAITLLEWLQGR
ncbi:MAG: neutral/alkaline non-lysosomal ceramidase N-terminal domain-containing protein [Alphaproteobacteria bacterium]|nr:neutral/alkaline non-lysosomal ceramidase N-terminal domain-containing protein [Alphaproteobacteria bacterium]